MVKPDRGNKPPPTMKILLLTRGEYPRYDTLPFYSGGSISLADKEHELQEIMFSAFFGGHGIRGFQDATYARFLIYENGVLVRKVTKQRPVKEWKERMADHQAWLDGKRHKCGKCGGWSDAHHRVSPCHHARFIEPGWSGPNYGLLRCRVCGKTADVASAPWCENRRDAS